MNETNTPPVVDEFIEKKKAESQFLSLEDGESVKVVKLKDIKIVTKAGFGGEEKEVIRLKCIVETSEGDREKDFDNGTQRFAKEMQDKGVGLGSSFVITREGLQTKTRYIISQVSNSAGVATPASAPAPASEPAPAPATAPVAPSENTSAPVAP